MIATFFPGKRSVAPSAQNPKFEFLTGERKPQLFATFNAVLNCWWMIGWWTTSIIPKKFKTAPKVPSSNLGIWALRATDLFPGKKSGNQNKPFFGLPSVYSIFLVILIYFLVPVINGLWIQEQGPPRDLLVRKVALFW